MTQSGNKTDVIAPSFPESLRETPGAAGLYYDSFENHKRLGQVNVSPEVSIPRMSKAAPPLTRHRSRRLKTDQVAELLSRYTAIREMWIDTPSSWGAAIEPLWRNREAATGRSHRDEQ